MLVVDLDRLDDPAAPVRVPVSPGVLAADRAALADQVAAAAEHLRTVDLLAAEMARRRTATLARLRAARAREQDRRGRARDEGAVPSSRVRGHDEPADRGRPPRRALPPVGVRRSPPRPEPSGEPARRPRRDHDPDPVYTPEQARARWAAGMAAQRRRDAAAEARREREAARRRGRSGGRS